MLALAVVPSPNHTYCVMGSRWSDASMQRRKKTYRNRTIEFTIRELTAYVILRDGLGEQAEQKV